MSSSSKPTDGSKILSKTALSSEEAKWIRTKKINWRDPSGKDHVWESAERSTRSKGGIDGYHPVQLRLTLAVGIIAILKEADGPKIVLGKQFRPPLETICIEEPAGICNITNNSDEKD
jgi:ADP-ribose pyrophosphatase